MNFPENTEEFQRGFADYSAGLGRMPAHIDPSASARCGTAAGTQQIRS